MDTTRKRFGVDLAPRRRRTGRPLAASRLIEQTRQIDVHPATTTADLSPTIPPLLTKGADYEL
jgi:hypothetical protein